MGAPPLYAVLAAASDYNLPDAAASLKQHHGIGEMFGGYAPASGKPDYLARAQDMLLSPDRLITKGLFQDAPIQGRGRKLFNSKVIDNILAYQQ